MGFSQTHGTWGERVCVYRSDSCLVTVLYLKPNKRCSWHKHTSNWNQFYCIRGKVGIKTDLDKDEPQTTILTEKQTFTVPPGVHHEFQTYDEPALVHEVAFVQYSEEDIQRGELGGSLEVEQNGQDEQAG